MMYLSSKLSDINLVFIGLLVLTNLEFSVGVIMDISQSYNMRHAVNQGRVEVVKVVNEHVCLLGCDAYYYYYGHWCT